jgi:hypothetical protein
VEAQGVAAAATIADYIELYRRLGNQELAREHTRPVLLQRAVDDGGASLHFQTAFDEAAVGSGKMLAARSKL